MNVIFFLTIMDDFSHYTWVHLMQSNGQTRSYVQSFFHLIETHFNSKIKVLTSDNGVEFNMVEFYSNKGVLDQLSCVESPQQNAKVEQKHQHLLNVATSLRFQANLPLSFWTDCVTTAAFLINGIPTPLLSNKSPYEMLFSKPPTYSHLKVFGCLCYASTHSRQRNNFEPRAKRCLFLGYPHRYIGYIFLDLVTKSVFVSKDIIFYESVFPYVHGLAHPISNGIFQSSVPSSSTNHVLLMFIHDTHHSNSHGLSLTNMSFNNVSSKSQPQTQPDPEHPSIPQPKSMTTVPNLSNPNLFCNVEPNSSYNIEPESISNPIPMLESIQVRNSSRVKQKPGTCSNIIAN